MNLAEYWLTNETSESEKIITWATGSSRHHLDPKNCPTLTQRCANADEDQIRRVFERYQSHTYSNWTELFACVDDGLCYKCGVETAMNETLKKRTDGDIYLITADPPDYTRADYAQGESIHISPSAKERFRNVMNSNNITIHETGVRPFVLTALDPATADIIGWYWWTEKSPTWIDNIEPVRTVATLMGEHPGLTDTTDLFNKAKLIHQQ